MINSIAIPYEKIAAEHRHVVCKLHLGAYASAKYCPERVKWWKMKEKEADIFTSLYDSRRPMDPRRRIGD